MLGLGFSLFLFLFEPFLFIRVLCGFGFLLLNELCWSGGLVCCDSFGFILLILLRVFILGLVFWSEGEKSLVILGEVLVFVCCVFFIAPNVFLLYIFFELSLFPIIVMILGFGFQIEKISSAFYLIFYVGICSFPFLFVYFKRFFCFGFVYFDICYSWEMLFVLSLRFLMKFPVYFLHLWLPKAHVEAPTSASIFLAGLLLKLGAVGFLRLLGSLGFCFSNFWFILAFFGMILAAFRCLFQRDAKSLVAYSSVVHMSFVLLSLVFVSVVGKTRRIMLILAHGYVSSLLFYLVGEFYHISGNRLIYYIRGGFGSRFVFGLLVGVAFLANSGVPFSLAFFSEFMGVMMRFIVFKLGF